MAIKLPCPHCAHKNALEEPLPHAGDAITCTACGQRLMVSYPPGAVEKLLERGKIFRSEAPPETRRPPARPAQPGARVVDPFTAAPPKARAPAPTAKPSTLPAPEELHPTVVDPTLIDNAVDDYFDRTVPSQRTPYGALPGNIPEAEAAQDIDLAPDLDRTERFNDVEDDDAVERTGAPNRPGAVTAAIPPAKKEAMARPTAATPAKKRGCMSRVVSLALVGGLLSVVGGGAVAGAGYWHFSQDLPTVELLQHYQPPRVTEVYAHDGQLLGEIYEQRRYVLPLDQIPKVMQDAFIAAEDEDFWTHGGVDWLGLVAATVSEVTSAGSGKRGASTITMQVTRNFLLTKQKTYERKIREILLSRRLEQTFDKEHILYLYLNEIYLGSGAYGVEAASRTYFDKHIADVSLAEAAMIAGLAPAPSKYSPLKNFDLAKQRQRYVLAHMLERGLITQAQHDAALAEDVKVVEKPNEFLTAAPHFTEYARRYLLDKYGHERVYNEGLRITTTCDFPLQLVAQKAVVKGVHEVDQRMGFRREGLEHLTGDDAIKARRDAVELKLREAWAHEQDPAGRIATPATSTLAVDDVYTGVVLEVSKTWVRVGVGSHEGLIPIEWSSWAHIPNSERSWRYWQTTDFTTKADEGGAILRRGDVVQVKVKALSTQERDVAKAFRNTPGAQKPLVALHLWQTPEVEAALLAYDLNTGAVRSMVGGWNYEKSEFNRALQSYRQVGSTFKPIVYAAAIDTERLTTATMVTDGPYARATGDDSIWKPSNYGDDYLGNITLRRALAMSRNTCTIRVLDAMDPGMNDDVLYKFARKLGIGGPPSHKLPEDWIAKPDNDHLCPWVREEEKFTLCPDRFPPKDPDISNTRHRQLLKPDDNYQCRLCDLSLGLGSASLTMEELLRAYSAFGTGGTLVEPYYVEEVRDVDGNVLETHEPIPPVQVMRPEVASVANWLLNGVVHGGTASAASALGLNVVGKTGTTNDEKDTWFIGMNPDIATTVWVGYDTPRSLGPSSTGGRTALPIWMDYMAAAIPKAKDRPFPVWGNLDWVGIEESTGRRVDSGGVRYPFLHGTAPESTGLSAGQVSLEDLSTEL